MQARSSRKSPRLEGYDYTQDGAYFLTSCTQNRVHQFGHVMDQTMYRNEAGYIVETWWHRLPAKFADLELDLFVVMPNHIHGIVILNAWAGTQTRPYTIASVMAWFKSMTTNHYIRGVRQRGWKPFVGKLWQRSFHDRIIRHERELNALREYVLTNPARWEADTFYDKG